MHGFKTRATSGICTRSFQRLVSRCRHVATFRTAPPLRCGAKIVAAVRAEAGAMTATGADDGEKAQCWEDGEEEGGEPVWEMDEACAVFPRPSPRVIAEAEK